MIKFISKSELDSKKSDNKNSHNVGEIYPQIFSTDKGPEFKENMQLEAGIIWLGGYMLDNSIFPRIKCPKCGKEEVLIPYKTIGSLLSGCHTIKFWCSNCHERFVTNEHIEYFRLIYKYILNHRHKLKSEQKLNNCTSSPAGLEIITKNS